MNLATLQAAVAAMTEPGEPWQWTWREVSFYAPEEATLILTLVHAAPDLLRLAVAAMEHGWCSCAGITGGEGPRPIGGGRFYHYQGCDYDEELLAALAPFLAPKEGAE